MFNNLGLPIQRDIGLYIRTTTYLSTHLPSHILIRTKYIGISDLLLNRNRVDL